MLVREGKLLFAREGEKKVAREVDLFVATDCVSEDEYTRHVCIHLLAPNISGIISRK